MTNMPDMIGGPRSTLFVTTATTTIAAIATPMAIVAAIAVTLITLFTPYQDARAEDSSPLVASRISMMINHQVITSDDVRRLGGKKPHLIYLSQEEHAALKEALIEDTILSAIMGQARLPMPTDADRENYVQSVLDSQGATRENLFEELAVDNLTYEDYLVRVSLDLKRQTVMQRLIAPMVVVTSRDIMEYGFGSYEGAELYIINLMYDPLVDSQILELLQDGVRAQEMPSLSSITQALVIPYKDLGDIREDFQSMISSLKPEEISTIKIIDGVAYRFYITKDPSIIAPFYDLSGQLTQAIFFQKLQSSYEQWLLIQERYSTIQVFN